MQAAKFMFSSTIVGSKKKTSIMIGGEQVDVAPASKSTSKVDAIRRGSNHGLKFIKTGEKTGRMLVIRGFKKIKEI